MANLFHRCGSGAIRRLRAGAKLHFLARKEELLRVVRSLDNPDPYWLRVSVRKHRTDDSGPWSINRGCIKPTDLDPLARGFPPRSARTRLFRPSRQRRWRSHRRQTRTSHRRQYGARVRRYTQAVRRIRLSIPRNFSSLARAGPRPQGPLSQQT